MTITVKGINIELSSGRENIPHIYSSFDSEGFYLFRNDVLVSIKVKLTDSLNDLNLMRITESDKLEIIQVTK